MYLHGGDISQEILNRKFSLPRDLFGKQVTEKGTLSVQRAPYAAERGSVI